MLCECPTNNLAQEVTSVTAVSPCQLSAWKALRTWRKKKPLPGPGTPLTLQPTLLNTHQGQNVAIAMLVPEAPAPQCTFT